MSDDAPPTAPPEWARFLSEREYHQFVDALSDARQALRDEHGLESLVEWDDNVIRLGAHHAELRSLAQSCRGSEDWAGSVRLYLEALMRADGNALEDEFADFESLKSRLKVRIYRRGAIAPSGEPQFLFRPASTTEGADRERSCGQDDLLATLVVDGSKTILTVDKQWPERWNKSADELYAIALRNVGNDDVPAVEDFSMGEHVRLRSLVGDSYFVASHILHLSQFVDPSEYGLIVAIPHRHAILIHRIVDHYVVDALEGMLPVAVGMHAEGPGSISNELFWWRDGQLTRLPARVDGGQRKLQLPHSFVTRVLSSLMQGS